MSEEAPVATERKPVATHDTEIDCIHWMSPGHASVGGIDCPHWIIERKEDFNE